MLELKVQLTVLLAVSACGRIGFDPQNLDTEADACTGECSLELAITSHSEGALVTNFEEVFTGTCDSNLPLQVTPSPQVTILSSACDAGALTIVAGFEKVADSVEDRSFEVENGEKLVRTVAFRASCPPGYVGVAGDATFGTADFCAAKYEMKKEEAGLIDADGNDSGPCGEGWSNQWKALSVAEGLPWTCIEFPDARSSCAQLTDADTSYRLITNAQWQSIARNVESVSDNWTPGGVLRQGAIGLPCAADDAQACYDSGDKVARTIDTNTIARHFLRNGEEIWDLSGNVWDTVDPKGDGSTLSYTNAAPDGWLEIDSPEAIAVYNGTPDLEEQDFRPREDYSPNFLDHGLGMIYLFTGAQSNRIMARGGHFYQGRENGVFATFVGQQPNEIHPHIGFRCSSTVTLR
jgi:hypothetical protein